MVTSFRTGTRWAVAIVLLGAGLSFAVPALGRRHPPVTTLTVRVTDYSSHKPVFQAHLTLEFRDPKSRFGDVISYSAKTNLEGEYKFQFIPMEKVYLVVTAPNHQTLGKTFMISSDNQLVQVNLRKPQPLR